MKPFIVLSSGGYATKISMQNAFKTQMPRVHNILSVVQSSRKFAQSKAVILQSA